MASSSDAVVVEQVGFHYGDRAALTGVEFAVRSAEVFGLLGPNGGGKTTLFRLMATLLPVQAGRIEILGRDVAREPAAVRARIGVTFQSPSVDGKLTVAENLRHQALLYGWSGRRATDRIQQLLSQFGIADRARQRVDELSGGLKRRVEIAKSLISAPDVLILDEPSTGLDPGARLDLWQALEHLAREDGVTVLVTTHLMEEAERCGRLAILDRGQVVALGTPAALRQTIGGSCITVQTAAAVPLARQIETRFGVTCQVMESEIRIEQDAALDLLRDLLTSFPDEISAVSVAKPTLEDVFIARTGHRFWTSSAAGQS